MAHRSYHDPLQMRHTETLPVYKHKIRGERWARGGWWVNTHGAFDCNQSLQNGGQSKSRHEIARYNKKTSCVALWRSLSLSDTTSPPDEAGSYSFLRPVLSFSGFHHRHLPRHTMTVEKVFPKEANLRVAPKSRCYFDDARRCP